MPPSQPSFAEIHFTFNSLYFPNAGCEHSQNKHQGHLLFYAHFSYGNKIFHWTCLSQKQDQRLPWWSRWSGTHLPMQGMWVRPLVCRAPQPSCLRHWAQSLQTPRCAAQKPAHCKEDPAQPNQSKRQERRDREINGQVQTDSKRGPTGALGSGGAHTGRGRWWAVQRLVLASSVFSFPHDSKACFFKQDEN